MGEASTLMANRGGGSFSPSNVSSQGITLMGFSSFIFLFHNPILGLIPFSVNGDFQGSGRDGLYVELWKASAGPLVEVPRVHEHVFYFPQGHMEQVTSLMNHFHCIRSSSAAGILIYFGLIECFCFI